MGHLYNENIDVAVKKISNTNNFVKESTTLNKLFQHPDYFVKFYGVIETDENFIVMEYCNYSLFDSMHIHQNAYQHLSFNEKKSPAINLSAGISYLHNLENNYMIHGDIKSLNVLINRSDDKWKLSDFDTIRDIYQTTSKGNDEIQNTKSQLINQGTFQWMAPEKLCNSSVNTRRSDVYSYGILLYEIFTQEQPWLNYSLNDVRKVIVDDKKNYFRCHQE